MTDRFAATDHGRQPILGVLGGTFDPMHWGHVRAAEDAARETGLERIVVVPCGRPAHRTAPYATPEARLAMVRAAVAGRALFEVDPREVEGVGPCRTVETLRAMRARFPGTTLCFLLGEDAYRTIPTWYQSERLLSLAHLIVLSRRPGRSGVGGESVHDVEALRNRESGCVYHAHTGDYPVSASAVRAAVAAGRSIDDQVPPGVARYIKTHHLYR